MAALGAGAVSYERGTPVHVGRGGVGQVVAEILNPKQVRNPTAFLTEQSESLCLI